MTEPVHLQLALPWPSYRLSACETCQFDVFVDGMTEWRSKLARSKDKAAGLLSQPNGGMVFRITSGNGTWSEFALNADHPLEEIDPVYLTIAADPSRQVKVSALDSEGRVVKIVQIERESSFRD